MSRVGTQDAYLQGEVEWQIAASLNHRGILSDLGRPWTRATIHQILTNPKYVGTNVYNRQSFKLKQKRIFWHDKPGLPMLLGGSLIIGSGMMIALAARNSQPVLLPDIAIR